MREPASEQAAMLRVAAAADVHCRDESGEVLRSLLTRMAEAADVLCLCGDLTDHGRASEAQVLASALATAAPKPVIGVLGNHDFEAGEVEAVVRILSAAGMRVLCGDEFEFEGVGFAGAKGFGGGFGRHALEPWGEPAIKEFVHEAVSEALRLETALARLRTSAKIVLLHYSPIRETVEGEPCEIMAYLGSSRLEEPVNRYGATAVLHGHAHHGSRFGRTAAGIPVYNVSVPLLKRGDDTATAFHVLEVPRGAAVGSAGRER
jgi:Icc-related predicted phosphoesterase